MKNHSKNIVLLFLFFLSGFTGLMYETLWIREFGFLLGNTTYAMSAVFAAYLFGLAIGSFVIGKLKFAKPLFIYALLELGIAVSCFVLHLLFKSVLKDIGAVGIMNSGNWILLFQRFFLSFLILSVPAFFMGGTLPVLARYFNQVYGNAGKTISQLYGINTIGAAMGCFATGFFFIRILGLNKTTLIAIALNVCIGFVSLLLAVFYKLEKIDTAPCEKITSQQYSVKTARFLIIAFILSGLTSFSYEILYSRLLAFVLGNRIFASTAMITTFILGIAIGSFIMTKFLHKTEKEPFIFSLTQFIIGITTFITILFFHDILTFFQSMEKVMHPNSHWAYIVLRFFQAALIMFIPTIGFGVIFPSVTHYLYKNSKNISYSIGRAYALNTIGCVCGIFITTFVLIPLLGVFYSMLGISLISIILGYRFLSPDWEKGSSRRRLFSIIASVLLIVIMSIAGNFFKNYPWPREGVDLVYAHEDASSLVTVYEGELGFYHYSDNTMVTFPLGKTTAEKVQKIQGHLPVLLHPNPKKAFVVGLGYGITTSAVTAFDSLQSSETVEIFPGVIESAVYFKEFNNDLLNNNKAKIYAGDGRYFVKNTRDTYDIIISNVNEADTPGSASCYTLEYYRLLKKILKDDGLLGVHMYGDYGRLQIKTLQQVFPYLEGFLAYDRTLFLIASQHPIVFNQEKIEKRIKENPILFQDLQISGLLSFEALMKRHILSNDDIDQIVSDVNIPVITDDRPILEYAFNPDKPNLFLSEY